MFYVAGSVLIFLPFLSYILIQLPSRQVKVLPEAEITSPTVCFESVQIFLPVMS